ncbi:ParB/RepB/Spo0J family partition protein [Corynebacterium flavescens]|uniref:ParB-like N-terminal domain-containing protein n=1 Tax=Corynebacterium flavescens TaxID=28028 RepID=A0AB73B7T5_CORFL|nr:ParB/RepB/Spo0J family partition protein [Corynebacterium flavescens]KAA8720477.1 transcriptional regulator [Corynebacterium flavescens]GEB97762.1 hypothetical protein CFL01nite_12570 [Corynebacterium flavescens]
MSTHDGALELLPIEQLREYGRNARKGNIPALKDSLRAHGLYKPLLVNVGSQTSSEWEVLAGSHTLTAMRELNREAQEAGETALHLMVPCYVIDVGEEEAARLVLVDNKTSDGSTYNDEALTDLLDWLPDLDGTGFTDGELADLLAGMQEEEIPAEEPTESPYDDFIHVSLQLPPHLASQWLNHANQFDSPEEALEYLLDHGAGEETPAAETSVTSPVVFMTGN